MAFRQPSDWASSALLGSYRDRITRFSYLGCTRRAFFGQTRSKGDLIAMDTSKEETVGEAHERLRLEAEVAHRLLGDALRRAQEAVDAASGARAGFVRAFSKLKSIRVALNMVDGLPGF